MTRCEPHHKCILQSRLTLAVDNLNVVRPMRKLRAVQQLSYVACSHNVRRYYALIVNNVVRGVLLRTSVKQIGSLDPSKCPCWCFSCVNRISGVIPLHVHASLCMLMHEQKELLILTPMVYHIFRLLFIRIYILTCYCAFVSLPQVEKVVAKGAALPKSLMQPSFRSVPADVIEA